MSALAERPSGVSDEEKPTFPSLPDLSNLPNQFKVANLPSLSSVVLPGANPSAGSDGSGDAPDGDGNNEPDSSGESPQSSSKATGRARLDTDRKRALKACISCRARKAKCEFANASKTPPCIRCAKEHKECIFVPSRRGGRRIRLSSKVPDADVFEIKGRSTGPLGSEALAIAPPLRSQESQEMVMTMEMDHIPDSSESTSTLPSAMNFAGSQSSHSSHKDHHHISNSSSESENTHKRDAVQPEVLAAASLRNPADALEILALTSSYLSHESNNSAAFSGSKSAPAKTADEVTADSTPNKHCFEPIAQGILSFQNVKLFLSIYFEKYHHFLPMFPALNIPSSEKQILDLLSEEPILATAMIIIASRLVSQLTHIACWNYLKSTLSDIMFGEDFSLGAVEALILLSENIPFQKHISDAQYYKYEERMRWNLIGMAIRMSYFLGLDQKTLMLPADVVDSKTHRERLIWTYLYLHDRQLAIRLGKAFWSRGPGLCFQNSPSVTVSLLQESRVNFPILAGAGSEYTTVVQATVELTQILTNIHDTLYPSRDRTIALVRVGEYYRVLDEFTRTFAAFKLAWSNENIQTFPLKEIGWATYHYARLYAYGFAFQAHVQRATSRHKIDDLMKSYSLASIIFPRGLAGAADAKFIFESIKSASDLLAICADRLFTGGALAYMPARFYGFFCYAAVFLIKAVFTGAVVAKDHRAILALVKRVIHAFSDVSSGTDKQHPARRSARQLKTLVRTLMGVAGSATPGLDTPRARSPAPGNATPTSNGGGKGQQNFNQPHQPLGYKGDHQTGGDGHIYDVLHATFQFSPLDSTDPSLSTNTSSDHGAEELAAMLSADLDSEVWLSYFANESLI